MNESYSNFLKRGFKLVSDCPLCKEKYTSKPFIIEADDSSCLVYSSCTKCGHAILAKMDIYDVGVSCVRIITDLVKDDLALLLRGSSINIDDVLHVHESLSSGEFMGNFQKSATAIDKNV